MYFLGRVPQTIRGNNTKRNFFSLIAGVPNVHPGHYVYQIADYYRSE